MSHEQIAALPQRGGQIESHDAAARTAPFTAFPAENDRGAVKLLQHARRDDADHADVPEQLSLDDDEIRLRIEFRLHRANDLLHDAPLDFLAFTIPGIEILRQRHRFGHIAREQQMQRFLRGFEPAGGIQARGQLKTYFVSAEGWRALRDLLERNQTGPLRRVKTLQTGGNENSIFTGQWHKVGNGAERDQIEQRSQIKFRRARQANLASAFDQGMRQFEGEANRAEFGERAAGILPAVLICHWSWICRRDAGSTLKLWIDQRHRVRRGI